MAKSKYNAKKIHTADGDFDSVMEYSRYGQLYILMRAGKISGLERQVKYELIPSQKDAKGKTLERSCDYIADFRYKDEFGNVVVEDVKGFETPDYIIKRKLMLWVHGIRIKEIKK